MLTSKTFYNRLFIAKRIIHSGEKINLDKTLNRIRKTIVRLHPYHWLDGFMDGIKIDLNEFE